MPEEKPFFKELRRFADAVSEKMNQLTGGEPEDQLRAPFENLMAGASSAFECRIVCAGEAALPGRMGRPDYAVHVNGLLAGYVELKAPGTGANAARFKGHNRGQFKRFSGIPNLLYTDGNEWALYRGGERVGKIVRLDGDIVSDGKEAVAPGNAEALERLLRDFLSWQPVIPLDRRGKIDLQGFADLLAPLCRMLRDDVTDALKDPGSPLVVLAKDWRELLFPEAPDERFADAYAQTVTFALLLARSEGAEPLTLEQAVSKLASEHSLLSRALQVLTDPGARSEMAASLDLLMRVIAASPPASLTGPEDPWLYFYEDFLAAYDPELRKQAGAYYTPVEVVHCQVRLIDDLLRNRLGKPLGFADPEVVTLDPAAGTGTYLLGVIEHALGRIESEQGTGAVAGQASALARNLYGFEIMVGPYAVTELRVSRALRDRGAALPEQGAHIYLTDTLESPHATPPQMPLFLKPIADQHEKALKVKSEVPVIVCLGNPPYSRHKAATDRNKALAGGWVRWGDDQTGAGAILNDFIEPVKKAGLGRFLTGIYNLYVYFWRWALWKVFERETTGPGVVSFISASSYLDGDAFCGIREHMRKTCDEIWILDLGGEGRGTRQTDNVFAIRTPVAIAVCVRSGKKKPDQPARVHYAEIKGERKRKLSALDGIVNFKSVKWRDCPKEWPAPFRPAGRGGYFKWPLIKELFPWQLPGVKTHRPWLIAESEKILVKRWEALLQAESRAEAFHENGELHIHSVVLSRKEASLTIADLPSNAPIPPIRRYSFRSFDRQYIIADTRLMTRPRPLLWQVHGAPKQTTQIYITTLLNHPLGKGAATTACAYIPDMHHFRGSYGGKDIIPLYRSADASDPNLPPGLLELLSSTFYKRKQLRPEDFLAYLYGLMAQPAFTERFFEELETREIRVPLTKDASLFEKVRAAGARLLWLHTFGERFVPAGERRGQVPAGAARCTKAVPGAPEGYPESFEYDEAARTLRVGAGEFAPVPPEVYEFQVSSLKVVQSWLRYRMKEGAGKKSSPLDDIRPERWTSQFTTELLELLWVLEATVEGYPEQARLLEEVASGPCFEAGELPPVPKSSRQPPAPKKTKALLDKMEPEEP